MKELLAIVAGAALFVWTVVFCGVRETAPATAAATKAGPSAVERAAEVRATSAPGAAATAPASAALEQQRRIDAMLSGRTVEFEPARAVLTPEGRKALDDLVPIIRSVPSTAIAIVGHTDRSGDEAMNVSLSERRARATIDYLAARGVDRARMTASGVGSAQPVADDATPEGQRKNRRIEFRIEAR